MVRGPPWGFLAGLAATSWCLLIRRQEAEPDSAAEPFGETTPPHASDEAMVRGVALVFLGGTCGLLAGSCGRTELPRRDADKPLEVVGEPALVREAGAAASSRPAGVPTVRFHTSRETGGGTCAPGFRIGRRA